MRFFGAEGDSWIAACAEFPEVLATEVNFDARQLDLDDDGVDQCHAAILARSVFPLFFVFSFDTDHLKPRPVVSSACCFNPPPTQGLFPLKIPLFRKMEFDRTFCSLWQ